MSLLLFLFYWIAIPVLVIAAAAWLWRRMDSLAARGLIAVACMAVLSGLLWLAVGEKWQADRQVRELCAKDGGVRVYETVRLPAERFDKYGQIRIPSKQDAKAGDQYFYEWQVRRYRKSSPLIRRDHFLIYRKSDAKLMGEAVSYARIGGDMPGPWHESSFRCPREADDVAVGKRIFIQSGEE